MYFENIGSVVFENKLYDSAYMRTIVDGFRNGLKRHINSKEPVAVVVKRSEKMAALLIAMLECGIPYLPIDIGMPAERIEYMISDSRATKVIISDSNQKNGYGAVDYLLLDDLYCEDNATLEKASEDEDGDAYILYTSGSTGRPKGVVVKREGLFNFIKGISEIIPFSRGERIACFTSISFDIFMLEVVWGLSVGLCVVIANENEHDNPASMTSLILREKIEMLQMTPSRLKLLMMYNNGSLRFAKSVRTIMIGGEKLTDAFLNEIKKTTDARIFNMYGPTETTIWSSVSELTDKTVVDIGKPIRETQIYLLKNRRYPVSDNEDGEICIGGKGVARGYIGNKELTDSCFITLPFTEGRKIYCTGDIGRFETDGRLIYIGRSDAQIKLKGYRVELEEIEETLKKYELVREALVCCSDSLIAFYIADEEIDGEELAAFLGNSLPEYMVPHRYIRVDSFKYTISGKADRKAMVELDNRTRGFSAETSVSDLYKSASENERKLYAAVEKTVSIPSSTVLCRKTKLTSLDLSSVMYVTLIVTLEDEFDIEFDEESLLINAFETLGDLLKCVEHHIENKKTKRWIK